MVTLDVIAFVAACLLLLSLQRVGEGVMTWRGVRVIPCPASGQFAAVELSTWRAAVRTLRVRKCSGWPERQGCRQACVSQIRAAPASSLVPNILAKWYQKRACVCCGAPVAGRRQAGLMVPERRLLDWKDIQPQKIPQALATASPVCRVCLTAETHTW